MTYNVFGGTLNPAQLNPTATNRLPPAWYKVQTPFARFFVCGFVFLYNILSNKLHNKSNRWSLRVILLTHKMGALSLANVGRRCTDDKLVFNKRKVNSKLKF